MKMKHLKMMLLALATVLVAWGFSLTPAYAEEETTKQEEETSDWDDEDEDESDWDDEDEDESDWDDEDETDWDDEDESEEESTEEPSHEHDFSYKSSLVKAMLDTDGYYYLYCTYEGCYEYELVTIPGIQSIELVIPEGGYHYDGTIHRPDAIVTDRDGNVIDSCFYSISYCRDPETDDYDTVKPTSAKHPITATITFSGWYCDRETGNWLANPYEGTYTRTYTIQKGIQTITPETEEYIRGIDCKSFYVKATAECQYEGWDYVTPGALRYAIDDKTVATINKKTGKVTVKGLGVATVTIYALSTDRFQKSELYTVTIRITPTSTIVTAVARTTLAKAAIAWNKSENIDGYELQWFYYDSKGNETGLKTKKITNPEKLSYTVSGLQKETYYFRIRTYRRVSGKLYRSEWSETEHTGYNILYYMDEGTNSKKNPLIYEDFTATITLAKPKKVGYKFLGWYSDANLTQKIKKISTTGKSDVRIYAKWAVVKLSITEYVTQAYDKNNLGICNVSAEVNMLNRRLFLEGKLGTERFTIESALADICGTGISSIKKEYYVTVGGVDRFRYIYDGNSGVSPIKRYTTVAGTSYQSHMIRSESLLATTGCKNLSDAYRKLLDEHPEGILVRSSQANHVVVLTRYEVSAKNKVQFYAVDPSNVIHPEWAVYFFGDDSGEIKLQDVWNYNVTGADGKAIKKTFLTLKYIDYVAYLTD